MAELKYENATITEKEGQLIITENIEGEPVERNLIEELSVYFGLPGFNLKLTKYKEPVERKPQAKYICPGCGKKVTSKDDDLSIKCLTCNQDFIQPEII